MLCVLIISGGTYSLKVDSGRQIFLRIFSWQFYLHTESFCQKKFDKRKSLKKNIFFFIFRFDIWSGLQTRALCLISLPIRLRRTAINQWTKQSYNKTVGQPINHGTTQSCNKAIMVERNQGTKQSRTKPVREGINRGTKQWKN